MPEVFAPEQIGLPPHGSVELEGNPSQRHLQEPLFDHSDYFSFNAPEAWPGSEQEWTSMVDFSLQDDWDWYFDDSGAT